MRVVLAGLLSLLLPLSAIAQVKGEVESIGFNSSYRPDCWTPMIVRISPGPLKTGTYQLQVRQKDLDGDIVTYTRNISLTGVEAGGREQRFWMYFLPTPAGLPDPKQGDTLRDLQKELKVFLAETGGKQLCELPVTQTIISLDPRPGAFANRRGVRFILAGTDGRSAPAWAEYQNPDAILGVLEDVEMVQISAQNLPENPLGYDAVDAVLWMGVDPLELRKTGDERRRALESWIRRGGHLVIVATPEWQKLIEFGDLLPVVLNGVQQTDVLQPLRRLAKSSGARTYTDPKTNREVTIPDPWEAIPGPFQLVTASAKPNAVVDEWIDWDGKGETLTPFIARQSVGLGCVTWVAQDLGSPALTGIPRIGWANVWTRVFDWRDQPLLLTPLVSEGDRLPYARASGVDAGSTLVQGMDAKGKSAVLLVLAVVFFIGYWLIAGPGFYTYLVTKKQTQLSWFMFGASAVGATALTALIVKVVLRGPPEVHHQTFVAAAGGEPARVTSRIGLYIPRDGDQRMEMKTVRTDDGSVSTIAAFPIHPALLTGEPGGVATLDYRIPVRDMTTEELAAITVPYRSTLKKFELNWNGELAGRIEGAARLLPPEQGLIQGTLTNATGRRLRNVYIGFKDAGGPGFSGDWVMYVPDWDTGVSLDLDKLFNKSGKDGEQTAFLDVDTERVPKPGVVLKGRIGGPDNWGRYFAPSFMRNSGVSGDNFLNDFADPIPRSLPAMTFFSRLAPIRNGSNLTNRVEMLRRGGRMLDRSNALAGGALVVAAQADGAQPVPFELEVEGSTVGGDGTVFYQFVLPIDRSAIKAPTTRPL